MCYLKGILWCPQGIPFAYPTTHWEIVAFVIALGVGIIIHVGINEAINHHGAFATFHIGAAVVYAGSLVALALLAHERCRMYPPRDCVSGREFWNGLVMALPWEVALSLMFTLVSAWLVAMHRPGNRGFR